MKLLIQPDEGADPLLKAIKKAKKSIAIVIFRFDRADLERALVEAAERGVLVHALIAFTNRGGEKQLRDLETKFLACGITVARTGGDLLRYHGKMLVVDGAELYVLAFNFTHADIDHSRSFGVSTRSPKLVHEAERLFEADTKRQEYVPKHSSFVVSPANGRKVLTAFIEDAKRELLIYDPKLSDRELLRVLRTRQKAGVKVRIIGAVTHGHLPGRELKAARLHARVIIRDRGDAFLGSQSLRQVELDSRREIGLIVRDSAVVDRLVKTFREDWRVSEAARDEEAELAAEVPRKTAKHLAKAVVEEIPLEPVVKRVVKKIARKNGRVKAKKLEEAVKSGVQSALGATVRDATKEALEEVLEKPV